MYGNADFAYSMQPGVYENVLFLHSVKFGHDGLSVVDS